MGEQTPERDAVIQRVVVATLRQIANWLPDEHRDMLREAADSVEQDSDIAWSYSCVMCQEGICDDNCALRPIRGNRGGR